jgi:hypothetical protein
MDDAHLTVPAHLRPALGAAAEWELETATDGFWPDAPDERIEKREEIMRAVRLVEMWEADSCSREQIAKLARAAAAEQDPGRWPRTVEEAEELVRRAPLTRDLIVLRDVLGGRPTQEELDALD